MSRIQIKRGTAAAWTAANPILSAGEWGTETDTGKTKLGDGFATWTALDYTLSSGDLGQANGVASLDSGGKVPGSQLPNSIMTYEGLHDVSTNTPALTDASGDAGQVYRISVGGTRDYGSGNVELGVGDYLIHSGTVWQKADTTDAVSTVNGQTGNVTLAKSDVGLGSVDNTSNATERAAAATLTNKTLTNPQVNRIHDTNNQIALVLSPQPDAVNHITVANRAAGLAPFIQVAGADTNINLNLQGKGTGSVTAAGVPVVTTTGSQTLTNKTLSGSLVSGNLLPVTGYSSNLGSGSLPWDNITSFGISALGYMQLNSKPVVTRAAAPSTATSTGVAGDIAYDTSYVYVCVATNTWRRSALQSW